jgi:hypothetical protein
MCIISPASIGGIEEGIVIHFIKIEGTIITISYSSMIHIQNIDTGRRGDLERFINLGIIASGILWKGRPLLTVIKYSDAGLEPQTIVLDLGQDIGRAQPLIYNKMLKSQQQNETKAVIRTVIFPIGRSKNKKDLAREVDNFMFENKIVRSQIITIQYASYS